MMKPIDNPVEPKKLLLSWRAIHYEDSSRFIVGELVKIRENTDHDADAVELNYFVDEDQFKQAKKLGFIGHPAFPFEKSKTYTKNVFGAFKRRLPPKSRRDYLDFVKFCGIHSEAKFSTFCLAGYSGVKLPNDGFELIHPFDGVEKAFSFVIEIAGFRYADEMKAVDLNKGEIVHFKPETNNSYDSKAVRIEKNGIKLGYVDRGRTFIFHRSWAEKRKIHAEVWQKNGTPDRPLIYLFVNIGACIKK